MDSDKPIVLAFSGGLDTSYCIPWLKEKFARPVITVNVNTGGLTSEEAQQLSALAHTLGAEQHHNIDARELFFEEVISFLLMGNVKRGHLYPLCVGAERNLQARESGQLALGLNASAVAHGCTAAGNDQFRFEITLRTLFPSLDVLAPVRDYPVSRAEQVDFLKNRNLPVPPHGADYSINHGLWGVTVGGKETLTSEGCIPEHAWPLSAGAFGQNPEPAFVTISFEKGIPVGLDGVPMQPVVLLEQLTELGARFGVGRGIHLGDTILGIKGRVGFEAPAATILIDAHRELEKLTLTEQQSLAKDHLSGLYGDLVHKGRSLDPVCRDIEAFLVSSQERVTGKVHITIRPGNVFVTGVESPHSLMAATRAAYGESAGEWTGEDAAGVARIFSVPSIAWARAEKNEVVST